MSLESVVRPAVSPNIRPTSSRVLPPDADSNPGVTLSGSGGQIIDLPYTYEYSMQRELPHFEQERTYDVDRIKQKDKDGKVNEDNYVEAERMKKIKLISPDGKVTIYTFMDSPKVDNIEIVQKDQVRRAEQAGSSGGDE